MQSFTERDLSTALPDDFKLVPLPAGAGSEAPLIGLRVHLVVRLTPDPVAGHFVLLRSTPLARVLLGCLADSDGRPQDWLEVWFQNTDFLTDTAVDFQEHLTNAAWDARWRDLAASLRSREEGSVIGTPLEAGHLAPAVLSVDQGRFIPVVAADSGRALGLCVDDHRLEDAGLPGYATSTDRYLATVGGDPAETRFVRVRRDSPANGRTVDLDQVEPPAPPPATTFGLAGGGVLVRRFAPLSLEDFSDVASGQPWRGLGNARRTFQVPGVYRTLEDEDAMRYGNAHLFSAAQGRSGRLAEALYLKLQAFSQALRLVRDHVRQTQLPLLNLTADSFRVRLAATGPGLPFLWTSQVDLVQPGASFALPLRNTAARYFQGIQPLTTSVYRPGFVGIAQRGTANVRIRKVLPPTEEGIALEGTIRSSERLTNDANDLISVNLPLNEGNVDLLGYIDVTQARSEGEAVFRTLPQTYSSLLSAALRSAEGSTFSRLSFNILSPLSTPFDLYSLGVVALRLLLAAGNNALPDVLDRAFSLAHETARMTGGGELPERIAQAFADDPRWQETLGFQHALHTRAAEPAATDADLPRRLWWSTLALVLRLFPQLLPESFCKGYGDAPPLALETVFDAPLRELDGLLLRWRAYLLGGWRQNQEISRVIGSISDTY